MLNQKYGVVYTPDSLAEFVATLLYRFSDIDEEKQALVLDPASGEGSLLRAAKNLFGEYNRYVGVDVDLDATKRTGREFEIIHNDVILPQNVKRATADYWREKLISVDLIIANPPWSSEKVYERRRLADAGFTLISGQYDSYVLFIELAYKVLRNGGTMAFIIPDSLFDAQNETLRRFLVKNTQIKVIARLGEKIFDEVNRATTVIVCKKDVPDEHSITECFRLSTDNRKAYLAGDGTLLSFYEREMHTVRQSRFAQNGAYAQQLSGSMAKVSASFEAHKQEEHELPMVMTTIITEDALAKTHRKAVVDLLNSDNNANVIGIEPDRTEKEDSSSQSASETNNDDKQGESKETRRLMSIVASDQLISNINRALQDTQGSAKLISSIADMQPFEAMRGSYNPDNKAYRVVLIDYQDKHRNQLAQTLFKNQCETNGVPIEKETRYSSDMCLYRVSLDSLDEMEMVRGFEGVLFVEEAIPIRATLDTLDDIVVPAVKTPEEGKEYPVVGVLDSGIEKNSYLSPWLLPESEEYYEKTLQDKLA